MPINYGRWLQRLGIKDGVEPTLIRAVQPVQIVGDTSYVVSPVVPPSGFVGGQRTGVAAVYSTFEVFGGNRGGVACTVSPSSTANRVWSAKLLTAPLVMANLIAIEPNVYREGGSAAFRLGTSVTALSLTVDAIVTTPANATYDWEFYVPPGQWLYVQYPIPQGPITVSCSWQEYEASLGVE